MSLRVCTLLALLLVTTQQAQARNSQRGNSLAMLPYDQESSDSLYEQSEQTGSEEVASLMYQLLQRAAQQQEQQQEHKQLVLLQRQEDMEQGSNPTPPEEVPMLDESIANTDKRGSYMSLCHFKICNMGRKRNLRRSQWSRF